MARRDGGDNDDWQNRHEEWRYRRERSEYDQLEEYQRRLAFEAEKRKKAAEKAKREAELEDKTHIRPGVGKFIIPGDNTLARHLELIKDPREHLEFSTVRYDRFDGMIDKAFYSGDIENNKKYEPLRRNIAAVRNYVYSQLFSDGSFDADDVGKAQFLAEMGREIGVALQRDSVFGLPFTDSLSRKKANIEGTGAAEIYKLLYKIQERRISLKKPWLLLGFGKNRSWGLPPIEDCPFCEKNVTTFEQSKNSPQEGTGTELAAAPQAPEQVFTQDLGNGATEEKTAGDIGRELAASASLIEPPRQLRPVSEMEKPALEESVELARKILENMRIQVGSQMAMDWLEQEPFRVKDQANMLIRISDAYAGNLALTLQSHPELANAPAILSANEALGQLSYVTRLAAMKYLTDDTATATQLALEIQAMPETYKQVTGVTMNDLLTRVEAGLQQTQLAVTETERSNIDLYQRTLQTQGQPLNYSAPPMQIAQPAAPAREPQALEEPRYDHPPQTIEARQEPQPRQTESPRAPIAPEQKAALAASSGGANFGMPPAGAKIFKPNAPDQANAAALRDQQQTALQLAEQRQQMQKRQLAKTAGKREKSTAVSGMPTAQKPVKNIGDLGGMLSKDDLNLLRSGKKVGFDAVKPMKIEDDILASSLGPRNKER